MTDRAVGAWSSFSFTITPEAKKVFEQALKGFTGVQYTPLAFATQVVAGLNYCFLCEGQVVTPENPEFAALLHLCTAGWRSSHRRHLPDQPRHTVKSF